MGEVCGEMLLKKLPKKEKVKDIVDFSLNWSFEKRPDDCRKRLNLVMVTMENEKIML